MWEQLEERLVKKGYKIRVFDSKQETKKYILERIGQGQSIGISGSDTIKDLEVVEELGSKNTLYWHWLEKGPKEKVRVKHLSQSTQFYLTSVNAITQKGELILIDGVGNRISALSYGPSHILVVIGKNKYCKTIEEGIHRARNMVAPKNARKMGLKVPCATLDKCIDCDSPARMCNILSVFFNKPREADMEIILVNEELGI